ncbi:hypothetical protein C5L31_000815 [Secundilactobacillus malefermentans]|uniref:Isopentenyl-diphosphate delta-isomerase n=1 Tax=Secundilactobacillus malefermentans TaxID=176292 RepID=A0A4R5NLY0_9LACO|nr:type 2 isopentenyl-diphosphate Delta-isomerase [Secundilactobacillus malefermentans]KRM59294.1 isopentenyl pyrophosphate isomerase [Secundilactobacillus malefermentans DSM 5705 = KCTC 3548]TDG76202.1 hypothetical protein C5L31_000815 [Secundilactobacillus malefermentans]
MTSVQSHRKDEHVSLSEKFQHLTEPNDFDQIQLIHQSMPAIALNDVDISSTIAGLPVVTPFFIEAMTGGSEHTGQLNAQLAQISKDLNLAMASGSQGVAIKDSSLAATFSIIRQTNPDGILLSNIGASQTVEDAKQAIEMIEADAIQVHVNPAQELIMPEGDRDFTGWMTNIASLVTDLSKPVIVKEVGFGMSQETISHLIKAGVRHFDLSGKGGTNFAQIENFRRKEKDLSYLQDWGLSTVQSLLESQSFQPQAAFTASGGIRTPLDIVKAIALGATSVGVAGAIMHSLISDGIDDTEKLLSSWVIDIKRIMVLLGVKTIPELRNLKPIISLELMNYVNQRNLDY